MNGDLKSTETNAAQADRTRREGIFSLWTLQSAVPILGSEWTLTGGGDGSGRVGKSGEISAVYASGRRIIHTSAWADAYGLDVLSATAARIRAFRAFSLILSPSRKSIARLTLPSRLELNKLEGSSSEAPLANVIFTTLL